MAKSANRPNAVVVVLVLGVLVALGTYAWVKKHHAPAGTPVGAATKTPADGEPVHVSADTIDPANEGRIVTVEGTLSAKRSARDTQLGISADAIMLLRTAEMRQWQETCAGATCTYQQGWSQFAIDARRFHEPKGHGNPTRMPITSGHFRAGDLQLGAFAVDTAALGSNRLEASLRAKPEAYPVKDAQLPSNLAVSFREVDGTLYAGDPQHAAVGDIRISYRIVPGSHVELTGMQRGERLIVQKAKSNP